MKNVFYASEYGAKLDSNVYTGGGTDDTVAIQRILDKAPELGAVHLIVDGAALVTGLRVYSNTTIECKNQSHGFFLKDDSNCPILINANPNTETIIDKNITLLGGTYNENNQKQEGCRTQKDEKLDNALKKYKGSGIGKMVMTMQFFGVENVLIRDLTLKDHRRWAFVCCNFKKIK